ncbi:MAG: tyrosine-type recombinase/integrase [Hyphomicrobiaceae bacterium]
MDRITAKGGPISTRTAQSYGDGLRIALLVAKPIRLRNLASAKIGTHLIEVGSSYRWRFKPSETKTRETIDVELPVRLTPYIDRWIAEYRAVFPGADETDALWLSSRGGPMSQAGVGDRICLTTKRELGVRINPHAFRHIVATSIAIAMPEDVRMTPFLLDHRTERTVTEHYDLANSLAASARYLKQLELRRQRALGRDRNR